MAPSPSIPLRLAHHMERRTRFTAPAHVPEADLRARAARLSAGGQVQAQVRGASLIVSHDYSLAQLGAALETAGLMLAPPPPLDPIGKANAAVARLNATISQASNGRMDLTNAAFMGLLAAGAVQIARGRIAGPGLTLFSQAMTLALLHAKSLDR
ncbi:hypothetical protein V5F53_18735 [Xanthobacter sp. V4C-4]|uniref:hypothetical protein n=1 Tax=Xanthobacter cornucopiae TaxID=3119924 RepID=UPI00372AA9BB